MEESLILHIQPPRPEHQLWMIVFIMQQHVLCSYHHSPGDILGFSHYFTHIAVDILTYIDYLKLHSINIFSHTSGRALRMALLVCWSASRYMKYVNNYSVHCHESLCKYSWPSEDKFY